MSFEGSNFNNSFWNNWVWVSISRSARPLLNHSKQVWKKNNREWEWLSKNHCINNYVLCFFTLKAFLTSLSQLQASEFAMSVPQMSRARLQGRYRAPSCKVYWRNCRWVATYCNQTENALSEYQKGMMTDNNKLDNLTSRNSYTCTCKIKIDKNHSL